MKRLLKNSLLVVALALFALWQIESCHSRQIEQQQVPQTFEQGDPS